VLDTTDNGERKYIFKEPVSSNKWCKRLFTRASTVNTFQAALTSPPADLKKDGSGNAVPAHDGGYSTTNAMWIGGPRTNQLKFLALGTHRPHVIPFYIAVQDKTNDEDLATYTTPTMYKLILVCAVTSTTFTKPTLLPDSPNTAEADVYQMIEPAVDYLMSPGFTLTNVACPINDLSVVASSSFNNVCCGSGSVKTTDCCAPGCCGVGKTSTDIQHRQYTHASLNGGAATPVAVSTGVMDPTLNIKVPLIAELEYDFYFRVKATAEGGRTSQTDDIKIRRVNCYYVTISASPPMTTALAFEVRDKATATYTASLDTTAIVYPFKRVITNHP
jgi:hypothetical protein